MLMNIHSVISLVALIWPMATGCLVFHTYEYSLCCSPCVALPAINVKKGEFTCRIFFLFKKIFKLLYLYFQKDKRKKYLYWSLFEVFYLEQAQYFLDLLTLFLPRCSNWCWPAVLSKHLTHIAPGTTGFYNACWKEKLWSFIAYKVFSPG